jgi:hypothetical protein
MHLGSSCSCYYFNLCALLPLMLRLAGNLWLQTCSWEPGGRASGPVAEERRGEDSIMRERVTGVHRATGFHLHQGGAEASPPDFISSKKRKRPRFLGVGSHG